jgi:hypothetical protein
MIPDLPDIKTGPIAMQQLRRHATPKRQRHGGLPLSQ